MNKLFLLVLFLSGSLLGVANSTKKGFAIVIDPKSYEQAEAEVKAYGDAIEKSGLHVYYIVDKWGVPDSIRTRLKQLYAQKNTPIEGAVFLGDIPVPMIRDAQHLTSAFKMDQEKYDWKESSVPSDRFYDDLNLEFDFIRRDQEQPAYFYYSLSHQSPQKLQPSFYSGRVRPTDCNNTSRYEKLKNYLKKVVREKQESNKLDQVLFFSGNGFISESMQARIDEKIGLYEHFPWLNEAQQSIGYIDHKQDKYVKFKLMNEMQRDDLDLAFLHHHGDFDTEYLNNLPLTNSTTEHIEAVKLYLRESMRHAKEKEMPLDSAKMKLMNRYQVPESWFEGAFDANVIKKDSTHIDNMDLYLSDFRNYTPNCRMVILDACFNGSFHKDNSIANEYIFSEGKTIVALANSVNVIQDKWTDRYIGLVALGMRAGNLTKYNTYLEAHVIGDPTFTFTPARKVIDVNDALNNYSAKQWRKLLKQSEQYADLQTIAIEKLFLSGDISSKELLEIFKTSKNNIVRIQTLFCLSKLKDDQFIECLKLAVNDRYEMVNRFAMNMLAKSGDERLIPALIGVAVTNNTSERIDFLVKQALPLYETEKLVEEFEKQYARTNYRNSDMVKRQIRYAIEFNSAKWIGSMKKIMNEESTEKARISEIRAMRNYHVHFMVPELLTYLKQTKEADIQKSMLEAFGWFTLSYHAPEIAKVAKQISEDENYAAEVRQEAVKTYSRLSGINL